MTAAEFPPGIDPEVWEEVPHVPLYERAARDVLTLDFNNGMGRTYFVRREPTPTMPVLPSEPCSIYPQDPKPHPPNLSRRWLVDYRLVYGGSMGGWTEEWAKSYRTRTGARLAAWWHYHLGSWGGSVQMTDRGKP